MAASYGLLHSPGNMEKGSASTACPASRSGKGPFAACHSCQDDLGTQVLTPPQDPSRQPSGNQLLLQRLCRCFISFSLPLPTLECFPLYLLCIRTGNLKLSAEWAREMVQILIANTSLRKISLMYLFTASSANGFCSNKAAVKVLLANPNLHRKEQGSPHCTIFMKC